MDRVQGSFSLRSAPITPQDHQIQPRDFCVIDGFKLPINGPFTGVMGRRGIAVLYVSEPGEVPLYYSILPGKIHWSEQKLTLPGKPALLPQGQALVWTPESSPHIYTFDRLPRPAIRAPISHTEAIAQYQSCILAAVQARLSGFRRVAIAQSGGTDSLLITWALNHLGIEVVPLTVCTQPTDRDLQAAAAATRAIGCRPTLPILVDPHALPELIREALFCLEAVESSNVRMAVGNILMARKCRELRVDMIFTGHGHDDVFGKGSLMKGVVDEQTGTESERWRDARRASTAASAGMLKMFSSTFRRYGIEVRHPYYDAHLLDWAFSQPCAVLPIEYKKQFVHAVARASLPPGFWLDEKHSIGYLSGSGLGLKQWMLKSRPELFNEARLRSQLAAYRKRPLSERVKWYNNV